LHTKVVIEKVLPRAVAVAVTLLQVFNASAQLPLIETVTAIPSYVYVPGGEVPTFWQCDKALEAASIRAFCKVLSTVWVAKVPCNAIMPRTAIVRITVAISASMSEKPLLLFNRDFIKV